MLLLFKKRGTIRRVGTNMGFYTDERVDFINSLLLAVGYWQKVYRFQKGEAWKGNDYQKKFYSMMKSHELHPFYAILKSISDMNPPATPFLEMVLYFDEECKNVAGDIEISELIPPEIDAKEFLDAIADLKLKYKYSVRVEQTKKEREELCKQADAFFALEDAKYLIEEIFPKSKDAAEPELLISPLSTGNFIINASQKNHIIVSPEAHADGEKSWSFRSRQNMHARYYQIKLEDELKCDIEELVPIMKQYEYNYMDKAYSMRSDMDDREALKATVRQAMSAYLISVESSDAEAEAVLTTAKKRGLSLVGATYNILKRTFSENANKPFQREQFYSELTSFIENSL